jgi:hypothetical protein
LLDHEKVCLPAAASADARVGVRLRCPPRGNAAIWPVLLGLKVYEQSGKTVKIG